MTQLFNTSKKTLFYRLLSVLLIMLGLWLAGWLQTGFRKNAAFLLIELKVDDSASQLGNLDYLERLNIKSVARVTGASRHFLAALQHVRAMEDFNNHAWDELAKKYETMVLLSPMDATYWELGSWQIARNAVAYHQRAAEQLNQVASVDLINKYSNQGLIFIQRGLEILPDSAVLTDALAKMYTDKQFGADYAKAAQLYSSYIQDNEQYPTSFLRSEIYLKAQLKDQRVETYQKSRQLILNQETKEHQVPVLQALTYYLQQTPEVQQYLNTTGELALTLAVIFNQPNIQESDIQRYHEYLLKKGVIFH